jgi:hypothetical protein
MGTQWKIYVELAAHILVATLLFIVIGLAAAGLSFFVKWLQYTEAPEYLCYTLGLMEYFVLGIDVLIYVVFVTSDAVKSVIRHIKEA